MNLVKHIITGALAACLLLCSQLLTQAASAVVISQPIPIEHQYVHLLRWQNHLDKAGAAHEKQGKDGTWLRTAFQRQLHFTDGQFAPIRESAKRLAASLDAVDAQAKPILASYRALRAQGPLSAQDRAAAHAQLRPLLAERANLIATEIATLNANLGPELATRLATYIETSRHAPQIDMKTTQREIPQ